MFKNIKKIQSSLFTFYKISKYIQKLLIGVKKSLNTRKNPKNMIK